MTERPKRGPLRRSLRWVARGLMVALGLLLLAALAGFAWQTVNAFHDAHRIPAPGRLVDVGGRSLHLDCRGEGGPTVVIEAGAQDWSTGWVRPQAALARHTRVCAYDRAGLGWSEPSGEPKDGLRLVADLHRLLEAAEVPRPVVLVGHSLGAMLARIHYEEYPEDVAALVLLEPGVPDELDAMFPEAGGKPAFGPWVDSLASLAGHLGLVRWMYRDLFEGKGYPEEEVEAARARMARPAAVRALASTLRHLPVTTAQVRANDSLGDLPLAVVYSSRFDEVGTHFESEAEREQFRAASIAHWEHLAGLSTRGAPPIVIEGADHLSMVRDDRYWPQIVDVTLEKVGEVRELAAAPEHGRAEAGSG